MGNQAYGDGAKLTELVKLEQRIGITFKNPAYLKLALIHSSYINEKPSLASESNERLEFIGDAVLGLVVAERLYQDYTRSPEGELTRLRADLVRRDTLALMARKIDLGIYLFLGNGEEAGGGREKPANLAGAFESLIAAIYLDQGLETAKKFILGIFGHYLYQKPFTDYKSRLQEILQSERQITPSYVLIEAIGPEHEKTFTVDVRAEDETLGRGTGKSKKSAETEAARKALDKLGALPEI
jgi:ribonuclease III